MHHRRYICLLRNSSIDLHKSFSMIYFLNCVILKILEKKIGIIEEEYLKMQADLFKKF